MTNFQKFFGNETTRRQFEDLLRILGNKSVSDSSVSIEKIKQLKSVIKIVLANADVFDANCQFNIEYLAAPLSNNLTNNDETQVIKNLDMIIVSLYRFVLELDLSIKTDLSFELRSFLSFVKNNQELFSANEQEQIIFARQEMPISILKQLINQDEIKNIRSISEYSKKIENRLNEWDKSLENHEVKVSAIAESLKKYETAFNFVGLYDGFKTLADSKKSELNYLRGYLLLFGVLLTCPLLFELNFVYSQREILTKTDTYLLASTALISLSLTILFAFFFRIVVRSGDACKAQLLQIELRKTLCQFIQSYGTYSKEMKTNNPESLAKFESLIFSGIVSTDEKLPTTFDGIEQVAGFLKALKDK